MGLLAQFYTISTSSKQLTILHAFILITRYEIWAKDYYVYQKNKTHRSAKKSSNCQTADQIANPTICVVAPVNNPTSRFSALLPTVSLLLPQHLDAFTLLHLQSSSKHHPPPHFKKSITISKNVHPFLTPPHPSPPYSHPRNTRRSNPPLLPLLSHLILRLPTPHRRFSSRAPSNDCGYG
jgi:hypothetical protein